MLLACHTAQGIRRWLALDKGAYDHLATFQLQHTFAVSRAVLGRGRGKSWVEGLQQSPNTAP